MKVKEITYIDTILEKSLKYLEDTFTYDEIKSLFKKLEPLNREKSISVIIKKWSDIYVDFVKDKYQKEYVFDNNLDDFVNDKKDNLKIIWGDALKVLKSMKSESIHCMVTSPPYYNAREYSQWDNLESYLFDMKAIIKEAYRVLDNHRVFVWNVGDIFDNDNIYTKSVWGKRRIPLGAYFIQIFEDCGWTFVDDFIWYKGEVQSQRHKNNSKPYPFYQYPMNTYEHILIFHKHRLDDIRYPCPVCGTLNVNGNSYTEKGLKSWECKNKDCFERSISDRGKRFSLKTIVTQNNQGKSFEISDELIKKWRKDIIKINPVIKINSKGENVLGHSAPFPMDIPEMAINFFSYPDEKVLDPFGGSMTSVIAAKKYNRVGIGIEKNKKGFQESIIKNIKKYYPKEEIEQLDYE